MRARLSLAALVVAAILAATAGSAEAQCVGACGAGCGGSCNYVEERGGSYCSSDGTYNTPIKTGYSCWTSPCCQFHDACLGEAGCMACNPEAMLCNALAVSFYGATGDGCAACAGPGFPYCDLHGSWGWFDESTYTETVPPGASGNPCPPPCNVGQGCPSPSEECRGATDCMGFTCPCTPPPQPCTGTCYPLCGQPNGCGGSCSTNDDVCYGCGYTNACGRDCGECPPPPPPTCDPYCYSCNSWSECGDYCGDCYSYWCEWTYEGWCCWDTYGYYWCEYYYP